MAIDNNINGQPIEPKESVNGLKQVVVPTTLYAFGNKQHPRLPRQVVDIAVEYYLSESKNVIDRIY